MAAAEAESRAAEPGQSAPDDADDLRGFHFRRLAAKSLTRVLGALFVVAAAVAGALLLGPAFALAGAGLAVLLSLLVVFVLADSAAEGAFFEVYAGERGLRLEGKGPLPPATPLLRKGDERYGERIMRGPLGDGADGTLALYTYETEHTDSEGHRQTNYYRYTLGISEVPESALRAPELYCRRKFGLRALEGLEDAFRSAERMELESEALDERYEIFAGRQQDRNWLRQLFSPTFIVWLSETAPEKFAFELANGTLCCFVSGHRKSAAELDTMREATATVAGRLREEARE